MPQKVNHYIFTDKRKKNSILVVCFYENIRTLHIKCINETNFIGYIISVVV